VSLCLGVDIGGTKIAAGVVDPAGAIVARTRRDTPADPGELYAQVIDAIEELSAAHPVTAVGLGVAGWIDAARATVQFAPHLPWRNDNVRDHVAAAVGRPVVVENDANAAAWAEYRFGVAATLSGVAPGMIMVTVGTGIGAGIILNDSLVRGAHGVAAELGHIRAVPDGIECRCGRRGCLEQYASGRALVRIAQQRATVEPQRAAHLLALAGGEPTAITGPMVTTAANAGDPVARDAFVDIGTALGIALADLVQVLDPAVLVVGGGVIDAGELLMTPIRAAYGSGFGQRGNFPTAAVVAARLGNDAGIVGAADLARHG